MAEKKKAVAKKGKVASSKKKATKTNVRVQRIENKTKLKTTPKSYKSARFNVQVSAANVVTRYGVIHSMDENSVQFITKPKSGSSKEALMVIDRANLIALEGAVGEAAKAVVVETTEVALYKDVALKVKGDSYLLTEKDGATITVEKRPGVEVNAVAFAEK